MRRAGLYCSVVLPALPLTARCLLQLECLYCMSGDVWQVANESVIVGGDRQVPCIVPTLNTVCPLYVLCVVDIGDICPKLCGK